MSKTVLITGASSGFGRHTAETLAHAGHRVFASMRDIAGRNGPRAEALRAKGIHVVELDVTDDASVERGVAEVFAQAGRLDVLVNNAGIGSAGVSEAFPTDQVRALFEVNVFVSAPGRGPGGEYRLDPRPGDLPFSRPLWCVEVRDRGIN